MEMAAADISPKVSLYKGGFSNGSIGWLALYPDKSLSASHVCAELFPVMTPGGPGALGTLELQRQVQRRKCSPRNP